jgi:hypothetical protein
LLVDPWAFEAEADAGARVVIGQLKLVFPEQANVARFAELCLLLEGAGGRIEGVRVVAHDEGQAERYAPLPIDGVVEIQIDLLIDGALVLDFAVGTARCLGCPLRRAGHPAVSLGVRVAQVGLQAAIVREALNVPVGIDHAVG